MASKHKRKGRRRTKANSSNPEPVQTPEPSSAPETTSGYDSFESDGVSTGPDADDVDDFYQQLYDDQTSNDTSQINEDVDSARNYDGEEPTRPTRPKTRKGRQERLERNRRYRREERLRKRRQRDSDYVRELRSQKQKARVEAEKNGVPFEEETLFDARRRERVERQAEQRSLIDDDALRVKKSFFSTKAGKVATAVALGAIAISNRAKRRRLEQKRLNNVEANRERLEQEQPTPSMYREEALQTAQEITVQDTAPAQQRYDQYYDTTSAQLAESISQYRYGARMPGYLT